MSGKCLFRGVVLILWLSAIHLVRAQNNNDFVIGEVHVIESNILSEKREYILSLPDSYENDDFYIDKRYPVLILLDGQSWFHLASGMIQTLSSGAVEQIPEMIVVAVRNTNRNRDFLPHNPENPSGGQSSKFRRFLEEELLVEIDKTYRTNSCRILVGHSYGGLFAVESFLEESTFNAYLAIDPSMWWGDEYINKRGADLLSKIPSYRTSLFVSQSNNPFHEGIEATKLGKGVQNLRRVLESAQVDNLRYDFKFYEREDHFSVPLITMFEGLKFIFDGYKYPLNEIAGKKTEEIKGYYQEIANRFGGDLKPPGKVLNQAGQFLLRNEGQIKDAIQILEFNKDSYPNSYVPYNSLGQAYGILGNKELALKNYEKALALNPDDEEVKLKLGELRKSKG